MVGRIAANAMTVIGSGINTCRFKNPVDSTSDRNTAASFTTDIGQPDRWSALQHQIMGKLMTIVEGGEQQPTGGG